MKNSRLHPETKIKRKNHMQKNQINMTKLERNLRLIPWISLVGNISFFGAFIAVLYESRGVSFTTVMLLQSMFGIAKIALEIPTGAVADRWSRRASLIWGQVFWVLSITVLAFAQNVWWFVASELLAAIGISLQSGANTALEFDTLKSLKREMEFGAFRGRVYSWGCAGALISMLGAAVLAHWDIWLTVWAMIPFMLVTLVMYFFLTEPPVTEQRENYLRTIKQAAVFIIRGGEIRRYLVFAVAVSLSAYLGFWASNPFWQHLELAYSWWAIILAGMNAVSMLVATRAARWEKQLGKKLSALILLAIGPIGFVLMGQVAWIGGAFLWQAMFQIQRPFRNVLVSDFINHRSQEKFRATVESAISMVFGVVTAVVGPLMGWLIQSQGFSAGATITAGILLVFSATGWLAIRK